MYRLHQVVERKIHLYFYSSRFQSVLYWVSVGLFTPLQLFNSYSNFYIQNT